MQSSEKYLKSANNMQEIKSTRREMSPLRPGILSDSADVKITSQKKGRPDLSFQTKKSSDLSNLLIFWNTKTATTVRQKPDRTALKAHSSCDKATSVTRFGCNHTAMIYVIAEETKEFFSAFQRIEK